MKTIEALVVVLAIALAVTIYFDYSLYNSNQQLTSNFIALNESYSNLNQSYSQLVEDLNNYNNLINQNSSFQTPISKSQAIHLALDYGGWNATSLRGYTVSATLLYMSFTPCPTCFGLNPCGLYVIRNVTESVGDYSPVTIGNVTYRYIWYIAVGPGGVYTWNGPSAIYLVDAATGEILNCGPYFISPYP